MASPTDIVITIPGQRRVDAQVGRHVVHTDQPVDNGGEDTAPSPFQLFLAALGTCAGIFVQGFCAKRGIPTEGIVLTQHPSYGPDGTLSAVEIQLELPPSFPEKYLDAVVKVAEQCSVKKAIAAQPAFTVKAQLRAS